VNAAELALSLAAVPTALASSYLLVLTAFSGRAREDRTEPSGRIFDIVVPAHDEEQSIAATVQSLLAVQYPRDHFRVVVVADNCTDQTAARAEAAGATVLVRHDPEHRGKGHALAYAFEKLQPNADAAVVVDADTVVSPNLLSAFARRIDAGETAIQADYLPSNPGASWRTRLMSIALGMFHTLRSRGRERLGLSCGLRGNGMCLTVGALRRVPHAAFSIVEDIEYGIQLGRAGCRVAYADEACVYGEMVSGAKAAGSQRRRWEGGRAALAKRHAAALVREALARRDKVVLDLAIDLAIAPLSTIVASSAIGLTAACVCARYWPPVLVAPWIWAATLIALGVYVLRGWQLSGTGLRGLVDLLLAPAYILWKIAVLMRRPDKPQTEWVRTTREPRQP
jgi:1,2-diacylglycerol 3-beta-glucosyltransferase